ncbi:hypothetical protein WA026_019884 [Henosepilachna vigintioctopunctata]|uniref:Uncharacterized protein n=1 Tax=Henosepilachna vigintioctopunctata TaxID=420089 RepID=A0AAW1VH34_9CUCU
MEDNGSQRVMGDGATRDKTTAPIYSIVNWAPSARYDRVTYGARLARVTCYVTTGICQIFSRVYKKYKISSDS